MFDQPHTRAATIASTVTDVTEALALIDALAVRFNLAGTLLTPASASAAVTSALGCHTDRPWLSSYTDALHTELIGSTTYQGFTDTMHEVGQDLMEETARESPLFLVPEPVLDGFDQPIRFYASLSVSTDRGEKDVVSAGPFDTSVEAHNAGFEFLDVAASLPAALYPAEASRDPELLARLVSGFSLVVVLDGEPVERYPATVTGQQALL